MAMIETQNGSNMRVTKVYMSCDELAHKYIKLQDDYNELQYKYTELQGAYEMRIARYNTLVDDDDKTLQKFAKLAKEHYELQNKYNELQNSFEESQDDLASANSAILKYEEAHNHLFDQLKRQISIVSELKEELRQMRIRIDEVEEARDNWKTEAIRRQNELNDIETRNLMREKPAQECCEYCKRTNCSDCVICPF